MNHRERLVGRIFGVSLIGFVIAAVFWGDRIALAAIIPGSFLLSVSLSAAINVEEDATAAQAFFPVLPFMSPSLALLGLAAHILDATPWKVGLWIAAVTAAVLCAMTLAASGRKFKT